MPPPSATQPLPPIVWALFGFHGRLSREPFWLGYIGVNLIASVLVSPFIASGPDPDKLVISPGALVVLGVAAWCVVALAVKRLHDQDRTGWLVLVLLIPFVDLVVFFVIGLIPGTPGPNRYGTSPNVRGR